MTTVLIIVLLVLLVTGGGYGYGHRGRHAWGFSRRGRRGT
jgi:hypothetical protein